jgi:hypothetical protein
MNNIDYKLAEACCASFFRINFQKAFGKDTFASGRIDAIEIH